MNCHLVFINVMTQQREVMWQGSGQVSDLSLYLSSWIGFKIWMLDCPWRQVAAQEITSCKPTVVKQASCILTIKREIFLTSKSKQESCVRITRTIKHFFYFFYLMGCIKFRNHESCDRIAWFLSICRGCGISFLYLLRHRIITRRHVSHGLPSYL